MSFLMWTEVASVLIFDMNLTALLETHSANILQTSKDSFNGHLAFCSLNCNLSTRASCWPKTNLLFPILYSVLTLSKVLKLNIIFLK
jgi:hypothetical protein